MLLLLGLAGCSDAGGSSESAFCDSAKRWFDSLSEDMTLGESAAWLAEASEVREVAPESIHDDLDLLAAAGQAIREPAISEGGLIETPEVTESEITSAREKVFSHFEDSCAD